MARRGHRCRCCEGDFCLVADGKPRTDPVNEGTWVPDAIWTDEVDMFFSTPLTSRYRSVLNNSSWTLVPRDQHGPGFNWFFFGSENTSAPGRRATFDEIYDWGNLCNWYSAKLGPPPFEFGPGFSNQFTRRARRLPPEDAVVHMYSPFTTDSVGPQTVRQMYVWRGFEVKTSYSVTATLPFPQVTEIPTSFLFSSGFLNTGTTNGGVLFFNASNGWFDGSGTVNGSAFFNGGAGNRGTVNGDGWFYRQTRNGQVGTAGIGTVSGDAKFFDFSENRHRVEGGATFRGGSLNAGGRVGQLAEFFDSSIAVSGELSSANFYDNSLNTLFGMPGLAIPQFTGGVVGNAVFRNNSTNNARVNGSAEFFDNSLNGFFGVVAGTSTFNDAACSEARSGFIDPVTQECFLFFSANNDDPASVICNGSAPRACDNLFATCGCG